MTTRGVQQGWILDVLVGMGGQTVLFPEVDALDEELGHDHGDTGLIFSRAKTGAMLTKATSETAAQIQKRAEFYEHAGFPLTAKDLFLRAGLLWGMVQYGYFRDDPRKSLFHQKCRDCIDRSLAYEPTPVERVEIDFDGKTLYGLLCLPSQQTRGAPAVILGPGMDMIKEEYILPSLRYYATRGMVTFALDGPGQGETLLHGLKVDLTNYERSISAVIDYLDGRAEVDSRRIGFLGLSMGSYWGMRCAATEPRLRAVFTALGCYGDMGRIFNGAQPNFKTNYMFMSGYEDEDAFDRELASKMHLWDLAPRIGCPVFMGFGEFDALQTVEEALKLYEMINAPKEICIFENEFHPLGGVAAELFRLGAEWLERALRGDFDEGRDERRYMRRFGDVQVGDATPPWWEGAQLPETKPDIARVQEPPMR